MAQLFNTQPFTKITKKDYLLIIPLDEKIATKFILLKLKAWELIGQYPSLHSEAHITVNHDLNIHSYIFEEKLNYYQRKLAFVDGFKVDVSGFGFSKHNANSYTIYAEIKLDSTIRNRLQNFDRTFSNGVVKTLHISIVNSVSRSNYEKLWSYFEHLKFECSFYADKITVLETPTRKFNNLPLRQKADIGLCLAK